MTKASAALEEEPATEREGLNERERRNDDDPPEAARGDTKEGKPKEVATTLKSPG